MSPLRTTADLICELDAEASLCTKVALAVGFEHTTLFVFSGIDDNLKKLNEMIRNGGEPIGFIAYRCDGNGQLTIACRPLEEYADEPWAQQYLEGLTHTFVRLVRAAMHDARGKG